MSDFDSFVEALPDATEQSVRNASIKVYDARRQTLGTVFDDLGAARRRAAEIKDWTLDNLRPLLEQFESACTRQGIQVHWAVDAPSARATIAEICADSARPGATIVKAKSMATEEIHLNDALITAGYEVVETDLGEFVVQIDGDTPSHIVAPIIHKNRFDVGASFARSGLGPATNDPAELAMQAREHLRAKFQCAEIGISGVNFGVAESGRLVIVENEGNNRLSTTAPRTHIAVMGIEKLLPRDADLPLFLRLLAGSATGQKVTVYTHFVAAPRGPGEVDGPDAVHLVLLDNGRSSVLSGPFRSVLRCIRCGACLNACPVYRSASGHAYGSVYSGPIGAVLAPAMLGMSSHGHLAKASTLCGECEEVCPVAIPIPELLLRLRAKLGQNHLPWKVLAALASNGSRWRAGLALLPLAGKAPNPWSTRREPPKREGRDFRRWWNERP